MRGVLSGRWRSRAFALLMAGAPLIAGVSPASVVAPAAAASPVRPPHAPRWSSPRDSVRAIQDLRRRIREDRADVAARSDLAEALAGSRDIEARREAAEALSEAVLSRPEDVDLWVRLARLQERRGFEQEARVAFGRALDLAPTRGDLRGELASHQLRRYQRTLRAELLEDARQHNEASLDLEPANAQALFRAVRLAYYEGHLHDVDSLCVRWRAVDPESPWPDLVGGAYLTRSGAWRAAEAAFQSGFARLGPVERRPFVTLALVDPVMEELRAAAPDTARYWTDYWRLRDPTPADPDNPRLLEHYRRVVEAELYFGIESSPVHGWEHAPGQALVRYGIADDFDFRRDVTRMGEYRASASLTLPALDVRYGEGADSHVMTFVDFNLNGRFYNPIDAVPSDQDLFMAGTPSLYTAPYASPERRQEMELWRFQDPRGAGRIEVVAALSPQDWPREILDEPHRLAGKIALYDERWRTEDAAVASWAGFERDPLGRLVGIFTLEGRGDSVIVGMETLDRLDRGRAAGYASLPPSDAAPEGPALSDIAFLSRVGFAGAPGRYRRAYGAGIPNPGHRYPSGEALGIGFEAYGLSTGEDGAHRARIRVSVGRPSPTGWVRILLRGGRQSAQAELAFDVSDPGPKLEQVLSIDIPPLDSGRYELRVEVEDLLGGRSVERTAPFTVVGAGSAR